MGIEKLETFNVPRDLLENIQEVLGKSTVITMATMVQFEVKPDKLENRVLVLTEFRLFILVNKIPCKVEQSISFLNIHSLESKSSTKLTVALEGRRLNFVIPDEAKIDKFILHIVESLMVAFPKVPLDHLIGQIEVLPATRQYLRDVTDLKTRQDRRDTGPCGSFSASYRCMADFHNLPFMPDVAWDIDTIYNCHDSRELKLADFDHLDGRHLLPILTALEYNTWFTSLNADHVKLPPDVINSIPMVMRKNSSLEELHLSNIGIKSDFVTRLAQTVVANPSCSLVHIDLSGNVIDDRGLNQLSAAVARLPKGATQLMLSQTSITAKGVNRLAESLCANKQIPNTLTHLDLSKNSFKGEDVTNLFNFLAQPNALMSLNLSGTECALDSIFGALLRGSTQKLEFLDLSNNPYLTKKSGGVQASCKQFFSSALALKHVNLSNTRIPGEAVKFVLLGLGSNPVCNNVEINLSSNNLGQETTILEICLPDLRNITALDISDNGLDMALLSLIPKLAKNRNIKKLSIGRNFGTIKPRNLSQVLEFVTEMIHEEDSELESLSLAGSKLRGHINIFINSLGGNSSLKEIDISGNFMGDGGARMLAKALQINTTLDTLYYDQNNITAQGFSDIAEALDKNYSMKKMPVPLNDVLQSMRYHQEKTESAIQKIESILQRNHSPRKFATDQGYRLQQGFLINTVQQMLDRSVVTLQSTVKKLEDRGNLPENVLEDLTQANCLVKDTSNSRQLLAKFQSVALKSETEEGKIYRELGMVADNLQASIEEQIRMNLEAMLESATDHCPTLLEDEDLHEDIHTSCVEKSHLPKNFTQSLVLDQLGADVLNKLGEVNLLVASHMSDQLIDGVLEALNKTHDKLINHLRAQKKADKSEASESEHRSSLLRNKSVTDDEPLLLDVKAISHTKRKSVYSRKLRPQSSLVSEDIPESPCSEADSSSHIEINATNSLELIIPDSQCELIDPNSDSLSHDPLDHYVLLEGPLMEPSGNQRAAPLRDKPSQSPDVSGDASPVPAPRKRRSGVPKTPTGSEKSPLSPSLETVPERDSSVYANPPLSGQGSISCVDTILHDVSQLSQKHARQKEYITQKSVGTERDSSTEAVIYPKIPPGGKNGGHSHDSSKQSLGGVPSASSSHDRNQVTPPARPALPSKNKHVLEMKAELRAKKSHDLGEVKVSDGTVENSSSHNEGIVHKDVPPIIPPSPDKHNVNFENLRDELRAMDSAESPKLELSPRTKHKYESKHKHESIFKKVSSPMADFIHKDVSKKLENPSPKPFDLVERITTDAPIEKPPRKHIKKERECPPEDIYENSSMKIDNTLDKGEGPLLSPTHDGKHKSHEKRGISTIGSGLHDGKGKLDASNQMHDKVVVTKSSSHDGYPCSNTGNQLHEGKDKLLKEDAMHVWKSDKPKHSEKSEKYGRKWHSVKAAMKLGKISYEKRPAPGPPRTGVDDHEDRTDAKSDDTDSTDVTTDGSSVGSPLTSREGTPRRSPVHNLTSPKAKTDDKVKAKGDKVKVGDLSLPTDAAAPNLEHLTKSRPKRPKMNRPTTRAGIRSEAIGLDSGLEDVQEEIDNFFTNKPTSPTDGQDPKIINSQNSVDSKDEVKEKKKGWSPFGGKSGEKGLGSLFSKRSQSMKSPEPDKKSSPSHKAKLPEVTEGAEVKSQSRRDRSKSPENELDKDGSKSEEEKDDLEEPKPQPRVMPGIPRMGFPGMGGGLMAEMKAKRASMIPLGSKMDTPAKDDSTKRSPQAPQPQASARPEKTAPSSGAKMPPGGRPLFPPSGLKQPTAAPRSVSPNAQADDKTKPPTRPRPPTRPKPGPKSAVSSSPSLPLHSPGGTTSSPGGTTSTGSSGAADTAKSTPTAATKQAVTGPSASEPAKGNGTAGPAANKPAAFTRGFSEAVDETDKQPARSSSPTEVEGPPTLKKRLSVREKAAALDKNRNEYDPNVRVSTGGGTSVEGATRPKPQEVLRSRRSEISTGSTSARSSVSSQHSSTEIVDTDTPSSQSGGRKSPGAEPQTNGSSKPEGKEEFLMYL